jgi:hypothetical protein
MSGTDGHGGGSDGSGSSGSGSNGSGGGGRAVAAQGRQERALARAQQRRALMALPARKRLDALLEQRDARAAVRALPAEDLYATVQEVGLADAPELVQLASPRQFQAFLDLGGWTRDRLEPHQLLTWLRAARGEEPEDFLAKVEAMDLELLELLLRTFTLVHDLEENPDVHVEGVTAETPEGRYLIEFKVEGAELAAMRTLVNDLIARSPFEAVRLLEAVRWEVPGELEETAYRFRTARLADLGFPTPDEAQALFAYQDPARFPVRGHPARSALVPASGERVDFLQAAVAQLEDVERDALSDELRLLANQALVAEGADPGDMDAQAAVLGMVRDVLNLGLEHATGGDAERAVDVVREEHLKRVFQLGFSLVLKLRFRADRLLKRPLALLAPEADGEEVALLLPREARVVSALRQRRPLRALKVEGAEPVPFRARRELAEAEESLARAEAQVGVLAALLGGTPEAARATLEALGRPFAEVGPEGLLHLAAAHALGGEGAGEGEGRLAPLPAARLPAVLGALVEAAGEGAGARVRPGAQAQVAAALAARAPEVPRAQVEALAAGALARLVEELGTAFLQGTLVPTVVDAVLPIAPRPSL